MDKQNKSLDFLFDQAKKQDAKTSFKKTKEKFNSDIKLGRKVKPSPKNSSIFNFKLLGIMLGISTIGTISYLFIRPGIKEVNDEKIVKNEFVTELKPAVFNAAENPNKGIITVKSVEVIQDTAYETTRSYFTETKDEKIIILKEDYIDPFKIEGFNIQKKKIDKNELYRFPDLDADQRAANNKQKAKILKQLNKKDKKQYVFIPSGMYELNGKKIAVGAFWMRNTEITVLEYRTFLFDLLIQGRKDEFFMAKPDQELWNKIPDYPNSSNQPMVENYFSHPAYNEYPVNNISREGAELYCKWLTLEMEKEYGRKENALHTDVRIPTEYEWMWAAIGGHKEQKLYPWNTNTCQRDETCYLANYKPRVKDSTGTMVNMFMADGGFYTVKVDSYEPNDYGLYNMSGNVAEMVVLDADKKTPAVKGGGWLDDEDKLEIRTKAQNVGDTKGNVNVGFRFVVTYISE